MNKKEFNKNKKKLLDLCDRIMELKQPEYTNQNSDVLHNFKQTAQITGIEPIMVWSVFFNKHVQSILSHSNDPNLKQAEPIESRFADAINYLTLGFALLKEKE